MKTNLQHRVGLFPTPNFMTIVYDDDKNGNVIESLNLRWSRFSEHANK